jgi:germination protein M
MRYLKMDLRKRTWLLPLGAVALLALAVVLVGCDVPGVVGDAGTLGNADATTTTLPSATTATVSGQPESTTTTAGADSTTVRVYFSRDEKMAAATRVVPKTAQLGAAAVKALLQGPTAEEKQDGMVSCIPEGTTFLGLDIKNGVATVNLSQEYDSGGGSLSMFTRLAQMVFTLTQFQSVDGVRFKLDGKLIDTLGGEGIIIDEPVDRADYEDMSPAILVESPTVGATAGSPMRITGTANVFEAVFKINIVNWDGLIIAQKTVTASSGTGTRGTFDVTVPFSIDEAGIGALIVFAESPKDGSHIDVVEIPLHLTK